MARYFLESVSQMVLSRIVGDYSGDNGGDGNDEQWL